MAGSAANWSAALTASVDFFERRLPPRLGSRFGSASQLSKNLESLRCTPGRDGMNTELEDGRAMVQTNRRRLTSRADSCNGLSRACRVNRKPTNDRLQGTSRYTN
jgi:hypothetical protein